MHKLLFINLDKRWGGGQEYLSALIDSLLNQGFHVSQLIKKDSTTQKRFTLKFQEPKNYLAIILNYFSLKFWWQFYKAICNSNIAHIQREHDLWLAWICKIFKPSINIIYSQQIPPTKKLFSFILCKKIISNSQYIQELLGNKQFLSPEKLAIIPPFINIPTQTQSSTIKLSGSPTLLMTAAYWKEQSKLLPIIKKLKESFPNIHLYFIGPSTDNKRLNQLQHNIKNKNLEKYITILPNQERETYLDILQQVDFFVYCYTKEAFGLAVFEACLYQKYIIAYSGGGILEFLQHYPKCALIDNNNIDSFVQALDNAYKTNVYQEETSLKDLKQHFNNSHIINLHITLYNELNPKSSPIL